MEGKLRASLRTDSFTESVIREMTRLAMDHDAINLAQGFPDFAAPGELKRAAQEAIARDLREAIAETYDRLYGMHVDPERNLCVTCGSTEAMISSMLGVLDPGDEGGRFGPAYE